MSFPIEQVDLGLAHMPTAVNRVPRLAVTVVEPDHVDRDVELLLDPREFDRTYGVLDRIEPVLREICIRVSCWSIGISIRIVRKYSRVHRVAETALVVIPDVHDGLLVRKELGKLLEAALLKRIELRDIKGDRIDLGEYQSRFFPDELRV